MPDAAYGASWYADTMVQAVERPALEGHVDADVCIVGGGLAGLTAAYELARGGRDVVLLEAERIACKASGRNGGFVIPGFALDADGILGLANGRRLWALSQAGVDYVRDTIARERLAGVDLVRNLMLVQRTDNLDAAEAIAATYRSLGTQARAWKTPALRKLLKSEAYFQGVRLPHAFHIHPLNYALGLAAAMERSGFGQIFERTPVVASISTGTTKRITVPNGSVSANAVILAQGYHSRKLARKAQRVIPIVSHIAVTARLGDRLRDAIPFNGAVFDTRRAPTYYRTVDGDRLLWGGPITFGFPERDDLERRIKADIAADYPQLGDVAFDYVWSGTMAYLGNEMPVIDEIAPGVWQINAFGGHGLNTTAMAGTLVARAIVANDADWRLFKDFRERLVPCGWLGRLAAYAIYRRYRSQDLAEEARDRAVRAGRGRA